LAERDKEEWTVITILVADDDHKLLNMLRRTLSYEGFRVVTAGDGQEALAQVATERPEAIVLDWMMPELDGVEVLARLRADGDETPILMLTARDAIEDRVEELESGADDYLVKPFAPAELVARLHALLRRSAATKKEKPLSFAGLPCLGDQVVHRAGYHAARSRSARAASSSRRRSKKAGLPVLRAWSMIPIPDGAITIGTRMAMASATTRCQARAAICPRATKAPADDPRANGRVLDGHSFPGRKKRGKGLPGRCRILTGGEATTTGDPGDQAPDRDGHSGDGAWSRSFYQEIISAASESWATVMTTFPFLWP
jgi:CheY-like chemotaxis protein